MNLMSETPPASPRREPLRRNELMYATMNRIKAYPGQVIYYKDLAAELRSAGLHATDESVNACLARLTREHDWGISRVGAGAYRYEPSEAGERHADVLPLNPPPVPVAAPETGTLFEKAGTGKDGTIIVKGESGRLYRLEEL